MRRAQGTQREPSEEGRKQYANRHHQGGAIPLQNFEEEFREDYVDCS